jgi:hypothetical protein
VFYVKTRNSPRTGFEIPISIFIAVVFSCSVRTEKTKISPLFTSNEMSLTAVKAPKFLLRFFTDMIFLGSKLIGLGLLNP